MITLFDIFLLGIVAGCIAIAAYNAVLGNWRGAAINIISILVLVLLLRVWEFVKKRKKDKGL